MNFIDAMHRALDQASSRPLLVEVHGTRLVETSGVQLKDLVQRARGFLASRGVAPSDRVGLIAHNSAKWAACDLAVLGAGAICVPLYDRQAASELAGMLSDCAPKVVLVETPTLRQQLSEAWPDHVEIASFEEVFAHAPFDATPVERSAEDPVTMIYTSGTSGEPKGVLYTVQNVDFMLARTTERLREMVGERAGDDRVFHYLPLCFAGSRIQLWSQLMRENALMLSTDLNNLVAELGAAQPHYFLNVPTLLERIRTGVEGKLRERGGVAQKLYRAALEAQARKDRGQVTLADRVSLAVGERLVFPKIRQQIGKNLEFLICGSAPLSEETQRWFMTIGIPVYQVYGLTETTAIVTMDRRSLVKPGYVGRAIEGVELKLSDEGELLCRGPNIFGEYWKRADATRACKQGEWFRTGDLAELTPSGDLRIVGRLKDLLVPESGHNVAPGPIEQRLSSLCDGAQVMLVGHARPFLSALVTGDLAPDAVQVAIDRVNEQLPHYRRVRRFHIAREPFSVENGLLTANQKLKRGAVEARYAQEIQEMYA